MSEDTQIREAAINDYQESADAFVEQAETVLNMLGEWQQTGAVSTDKLLAEVGTLEEYGTEAFAYALPFTGDDGYSFDPDELPEDIIESHKTYQFRKAQLDTASEALVDKYDLDPDVLQPQHGLEPTPYGTTGIVEELHNVVERVGEQWEDMEQYRVE